MATSAFANSSYDDIADRTAGGYAVIGALAVMDDASFDEYAKRCGLDPAEFAAGEFKGIAVRDSVIRGGERYAIDQLFKDAGAVQSVYGGLEDGFETFSTDGTGIMAFVREGSAADRPGSERVGEDMVQVPLDEVKTLEVGLEVAALAETEPDIMGGSVPYEPTIVVPLRAVSGAALMGDEQFCSSFAITAAFDAEDHEAATIAIEKRANEYLGSLTSAYDFAASRDDNLVMGTIVDVLTMLFTGILTLIAIANVFNTVTNSLILRRREFAVMRSVGMGNTQFRRMIACECLGYGIRGLVPGLIISAGVAWLLHSAMTLSMEGFDFVLPWGHMGIAVCLVVLAMGVSVAYGLRRCRMDSVVEALREDAV